MSRARPISTLAAFALTAVLLGGAASLLVIEVGLRIYNPIPQPVRGKSIVLPVNKTMIYSNPVKGAKVDATVRLTRNALGFRGPEPPPDFAGHLTFVTVGGSTTECRFLTDSKTWPTHLADRLSQRFEHVWLNNAGLDGHSTYGHLVLLQQFVLDLKPDYVLLLVGVNDVGRADLGPMDRSIDPSAQDLRQQIVAKSELLSTAQVLWRSLRASRMGLEHVQELDLTRVPTRPEAPEELAAHLAEHRERYVDAYASRLERIIEVTRAAGSEPVLITQPALWGVGIDPATGVELGPLDSSGIRSATRWQILERYNDVTRRVGARHAVLVIDAAQQMPKDSRLYYDWMHYSNAGADRLAGIIDAALIPWLEARENVRDSPRRTAQVPFRATR